MALIYIVEDDGNIREIEQFALQNSGYAVRAFGDGESLLASFTDILPDLILLDIMLPGIDGLNILRKIRADGVTKKIPVIMVTAKTKEIDTVKGLDLGADDYIAKPFGVMELISRVKAILRRMNTLEEEPIITYKEISLDQERRTCKVQGEEIELTFKEYELLRFFMTNTGIVLSRESIMNSVWGTEYIGESRTVDMHIKTLRKKMKEAGNYIITVRNVGYKLE